MSTPNGTTSIDVALTPPPPTTTTTTTVPSTPPSPPKMTEAETIGENQNPVVRVFDYDLDIDSIIVSVLLVLIWTSIWFGSGLSSSLRYDWVFTVVFILFIVYNGVNVISAGTTSGGVVYELNILLTVEQMVAILLGSVILFLLFHKGLQFPEGCSGVVSKLLMSNVVILMVASLWVNVITTGRAFRFIRKFKQGIYNIALTFFIIVGIIYIKGIRCS